MKQTRVELMRRIRDLEAENARLKAELQRARQQVSDAGWAEDNRRQDLERERLRNGGW